MKIALVSMFMNSSKYLGRYFDQVNALRRSLAARGDDLRLCVVEGDSTDDTYPRLREQLHPDDVLTRCDHGGPVYGSVDVPQRWRQISKVCNHLLDAIPADSERVVYVESDLFWKTEMVLTLLDHLDADAADAAAPMCFSVHGFFYDWYGYRAEGRKFSHDPPYHPMLARSAEHRLLPMDAVGSCCVMKGEVARRCRFINPDEAITSFCRDMRDKGYRLMLDRLCEVLHP